MRRLAQVRSKANLRQILLFWASIQALLTGYFFLAQVYGEGASYSWLATVNLVGQSLFILVCAWVCIVVIRNDSLTLWTPIPAYLVSSLVYLGFGSMSTFVANEKTRAALAASIYPVAADRMVSANLLSMFGVMSCVIGIYVGVSARLKATTYAAVTRTLPTWVVATLFLTIGLSLKYLFLAPVKFGLLRITAPGVLQNLIHVVDLGFAYALFLAIRGRRGWWLVFWLLWPAHFGLTLLEFSKRSAAIAILLPAVGAYVGHRSVRRSIPWLFAVVGMLVALQPVNTYARLELEDARNRNVRFGISERASLLVRALQKDADDIRLPHARGVQDWWLRLNYAGPQIKAMAMRDRNGSLAVGQSPFIYFIPRFLWPDKPQVVNPGARFHSEVVRSATSTTNVGITVYADGYLQFGWVGAFVLPFLMGLIFGIISRFSYLHASQQNLLYMPAILVGVRMAGFGPTGFFQNKILAALPIYIAYMVFTSLVVRIVRNYNLVLPPTSERVTSRQTVTKTRVSLEPP